MEIERKIEDLHKLELNLFDKSYEISTKIKHYNPNFKEDIRYTTYNTLASVIRSIKLLLILKNQYLDTTEWWNSNYENHFAGLTKFIASENDRKIYKSLHYEIIPNDLMQFILVGAYSSFFSLMESRFRIFIIIFLISIKKAK